MRPSVLHALVIGLCFVPVAARADTSVPELAGYRMSDYKAPTPATLDGGPTLTVAQAHTLWAQKAAVFVDVLPQPPKPANLAPGTLWRDKPRLDIPGSIWLPDTGYGALAPVTEDYFRRGLTHATGGNKGKSLVFYCLRHCWMSWNAAKRAKSLGYSHVLWYADGTEGWSEAGYPLKEQKPFPRP
jgi:PQQ-dependent catabolism-associated CXXCW motif protein